MFKLVTHEEPIWYHSEPSIVPYSSNQFLGCNLFCRFLKQDGSSHVVSFSCERKSERCEKILKTQNPCLRPGIRLRSILHLGCNWSGQLLPYGSPRPPETNDVCMNTKTAYYFIYYDYEGYSTTGSCSSTSQNAYWFDRKLVFGCHIDAT